MSLTTDAAYRLAVYRVVMRSACAPGVILLLMLGFFPHAGGEASAQLIGLVDSPAPLRVGSLGVGLEAAQFDGLASDRLAYGPPTGLPERREPRGFDPSVARPRVKPAPSAVMDGSGLSGIREPLPRLRESLPLLVQPLEDQVGSAVSSGTVPSGVVPTGTVLPVGSGPNLSQPSLGRAFPPALRPMVGPAVGVKPRPLTPSGR